jgi:hypothetical protein
MQHLISRQGTFPMKHIYVVHQDVPALYDVALYKTTPRGMYRAVEYAARARAGMADLAST